MNKPNEYFVIMATDVFGPDPGDGKNAWLVFNGNINIFDADNYHPHDWDMSMVGATFFKEETACKLWAVIEQLMVRIDTPDRDLSQIFGFVPQTIALVRLSTDGSWQMKPWLMSTYIFREKQS